MFLAVKLKHINILNESNEPDMIDCLLSEIFAIIPSAIPVTYLLLTQKGSCKVSLLWLAYSEWSEGM